MNADDAIHLLHVNSRCSVVDLSPGKCGELATVIEKCQQRRQEAIAEARRMLDMVQAVSKIVRASNERIDALNNTIESQATRIEAEREACARLADDHAAFAGPAAATAAKLIARQIRERGTARLEATGT